MPRRYTPVKLEGYEVSDPARAYLGEGTYGTVYLARETATGEYVAIKQHHNIAREKGIPSTVLREATFLKLLKNSPHVVKLHKVMHVQSNANAGSRSPTSFMIFEYLDCDLSVYARRNRPLRPDIVKRLMYHVLLGLHHCHSMRLMHRDLKPHNILIDTTDPNKPIAKLADFGFGRTFSAPIRQLTEEIITLWYRPPEVLLGYEGHSPAVDIWSIACIFSELYENVTLFRGDCQYDQLIQIFRVLGTPSAEEWNTLFLCDYWHEYPDFKRQNLADTMQMTPPDAIDLLDRMLVHNPAKRPTAEACLRHPYFTSIFKESDLKMEPLLPKDTFAPKPKSTKAASDSAVLTISNFNGHQCVFGHQNASK